jgi:hypothetical protein
MSEFEPHYSGPITGPIKRTKAVPNGEPGAYEIHWGPMEKAVAGVLVILAGAAVIGGVAMYREVGELRELVQSVRDEARAANAVAVKLGEEVKGELQHHLDYSRDMVPKLMTREEYQRDHERRH